MNPEPFDAFKWFGGLAKRYGLHVAAGLVIGWVVVYLINPELAIRLVPFLSQAMTASQPS